jgi:hypothetical protein
MYAVCRTAKFDKEFAKQLSTEEQRIIVQFEKEHLKTNPYVGDPLSYSFFREKKIESKRVYFLIYDDIKAVLMVGVSNKKTQQETIDVIKSRLPDYYEVVKEAIKQHGESDRA